MKEELSKILFGVGIFLTSIVLFYLGVATLEWARYFWKQGYLLP